MSVTAKPEDCHESGNSETCVPFNGDVEMRKSDHQLQQALYISTWSKKDGMEVRYDQENTGYGWKTNQKIESYVASQPTSCEMKRPARL